MLFKSSLVDTELWLKIVVKHDIEAMFGMGPLVLLLLCKCEIYTLRQSSGGNSRHNRITNTDNFL